MPKKNEKTENLSAERILFEDDSIRVSEIKKTVKIPNGAEYESVDFYDKIVHFKEHNFVNIRVDINRSPVAYTSIDLNLNGEPAMDGKLFFAHMDLMTSSLNGAEQHHFIVQDLVQIIDSPDDKTTICREELDIEFDLLLYLNKLKTFYISKRQNREDED